jgi:hypothetical protein
VAVEGLKY